MQEVFPLVRDSFVEFSHFEVCFLSVFRSFLLLGSTVLEDFQSFEVFTEELRVRNFGAIRKNSEVFYAEINAYGCIWVYRSLIRLFLDTVINKDGDKELVGRCFADCRCFDLAYELSIENDIDLAKLGYIDLMALEIDSYSLWILNALTTRLLLELRKLCPFAKEVGEGDIKVS